MVTLVRDRDAVLGDVDVFGVEAFVIVWSGVVSFGSVYDKWGFAPPPAVKTVLAQTPPGLTQRQAAKPQPKRLSIAKFLSEGRLRSAWHSLLI